MKYDPIAKKYESYGKEAVTDWVLGYFNVVKYLIPIRNRIVLDYGCGDGKFSRFIRDKAAKVIGVDVSKEMLKLAERADSKNIKYHQIKSGDLKIINSNSVDYAVCAFVLGLPSKFEIIKIFKEINRVLKKGGKFVILHPNREKSNGLEFISFKLNKIKHLVSGAKVSGILKKNSLKIGGYFWFQKDYVNMLKKTNFDICKIEEPLAKGKEHRWINENRSPPFFIIISIKK